MTQVTDAHIEHPPAPTISTWQPLHQRVFRMLWIATVVSNVGSWMSDVGVNWSMLTLSADPLDIALVQAASSLPMFLFALPSGVMADIVDRRKYLLFSQLWVFIAAAGLTVLSFTGQVTPTVLLVAAFLLSVGSAMSSPPFQAVVPDLVSKAELGPAIALNSLGVNISRAIGPALGGFLLSLAGPWMVFLLNALSVLGVAWVLWRWKPAASVQRLPPEHFFSAVRAGVRYVHAAPVLRNVLIRTVAFFVFASAGWALLPLVARRELGLGPAGYGIMLACIGLGAIAGAVLLPRLRQRLNADRLMVAASLVFVLTMLALAFVRHFWLLNLFEFFTGFAWIAVLSTLNLGAQRRPLGKSPGAGGLSDGVLRLDDRRQRHLGTDCFAHQHRHVTLRGDNRHAAGERHGAALEAGERSEPEPRYQRPDCRRRAGTYSQRTRPGAGLL